MLVQYTRVRICLVLVPVKRKVQLTGVGADVDPFVPVVLDLLVVHDAVAGEAGARGVELENLVTHVCRVEEEGGRETGVVG